MWRLNAFVKAGCAVVATCAVSTAMAQVPVLDFVVVDNLGHLPMIVGAQKGIFKEHGLDVKLKIVKSGTEIVNALKSKEVQGGNMSVTTYIKGRQAGEPVSVFALAMNDATRANADDTLAIVARKDSGIKAGDIASLKGNPELIPQLSEGKVDAVVSLEPWNILILSKVPGSFLVKRGGGYLSYMMVSTFQDETIKTRPDLVEKFALGLAASAHYTRMNRAEAVELFAKAVPGVDIEITKKAIQHLNYDPRISKINMSAFNAAQDSLIEQGSSQVAKRLDLPKVVLGDIMMKIEKSHPQFFKDLKQFAY